MRTAVSHTIWDASSGRGARRVVRVAVREKHVALRRLESGVCGRLATDNAGL